MSNAALIAAYTTVLADMATKLAANVTLVASDKAALTAALAISSGLDASSDAVATLRETYKKRKIAGQTLRSSISGVKRAKWEAEQA